MTPLPFILLLLSPFAKAWFVPSTSLRSSLPSSALPRSATALSSSSGPDLNDLDNVPTLDAKDLDECKKVDDKEWLRGDMDGMDVSTFVLGGGEGFILYIYI